MARRGNIAGALFALAGGVGLFQSGALDRAIGSTRDDEGYMSADNPWSTDYVPPAEAQAASAVHYRNCDAVRAAGADPVRIGYPGYAAHLDRDGDGVGCEPYYGR